jgi:hypothetical protein
MTEQGKKNDAVDQMLEDLGGFFNAFRRTGTSFPILEKAQEMIRTPEGQEALKTIFASGAATAKKALGELGHTVEVSLLEARLKILKNKDSGPKT